MKIVQIAPVIEGSLAGGTYSPNEDATLYGMDEDGKPYYWGKTQVQPAKYSGHTQTEPAKYRYEWKPVEF